MLSSAVNAQKSARLSSCTPLGVAYSAVPLGRPKN